jgi:hypothetical protein
LPWVSNPPTDSVLCVIIALQRLCLDWRGLNQCFLNFEVGRVTVLKFKIKANGNSISTTFEDRFSLCLTFCQRKPLGG